MIELHGLSRRYGDLLAVDNLSCQIQQGEVVGLLGHNGAGKTTVMKMLTGYLDASVGSITIEGLSMADSRLDIQQKIGYLPENCPVYGDMTVAGFLAFRAEQLGMIDQEQPAALRQALVSTGLADRALQRISTLSRGLRQRVGVAQAILHQPSIVILDEPTNGLDPSQIQQMRNLIRQLAKHATVIISTHVLSEVEAVCDRVLMLSQGRLVLDSQLDELEKDTTLRLESDQTDETLADALNAIDGVATVDPVDSNEWRLTLEDDWRPVAARVATLIHDKGGSLYKLAPEVRSLESIFREVNEQAFYEMPGDHEEQEVAHA